MKHLASVCIIALLSILKISAQPYMNYSMKNIIQFSGMVKDEMSNAPIPFAIVYADKEKRGTVTTMEGFFSFAAAKGDVIIIKSIGYKALKILVPLDAPGSTYYKDIQMTREIYELDTITIYPLPKPHQLRQAIANLDIPNDMVIKAQKAIEKSKLDELAKNTRYDGNENFNQYLKNQVQSYYHYGQPAPIKLFDVFSWAEFIKSLKKNKGSNTEKGTQYKYPEF